MADFCSLAQMCYAGRGTTAITDRSNQRSDPSHLKSLPEKSKPMLRVDLKAKISMAQWNGMNSFLNIKWTYFSWAQLHSYLWLYENWRNVSWCDHKQKFKNREAFRTLVESLVQMTTFISRIFLKLVELQFKVPISAE